MIRNLKVLGLALVAVLAMSAMAASSALAVEEQGELTSDGPVRLTGTDTVGAPSVFTFNATQKHECHGHYSAGNEGDAQTEEFPVGSKKFRHKYATLPLTTLTVSPEYTKCVGRLGAQTAPATVTMNGCDYLLHIGTTNKVGAQYAVTTDIVCPVGKVIETHVYQNAEHKTTICTYTYAAQTGKTGLFAQNEAGGKVTIGGTVNGIVATRHNSILCGGHAEVNNASFHIHAILSGTNAEGKATEISLTEKGI